ncbi:GNAT family N-acetyltransferase [Pseudorhodoferax aquiterrae]|uniref:GNAT family N-acetyltransferase n=1 Tax=Pseudorhodoferax aquiterrae TaxID=747304 RepID=UPI001675C44F|nr:N-acetyltransferase [Pseudorhodoferax aquiterrae]
MSRCTIRAEAPGDVEVIDAVTQEAFAGAPFSSGTEHLIVKALRSANALAVSLVAEAAGCVVGHVAVSPVHVAGKPQAWFGLGPLSVASAHQRRGVGSALVRAALAQLQADGAAGCVLLGDPAFYCRFGFVQDSSLVLPGVPAQHFMRLAWQTPVPAGQVSYHEAFNAAT